MAAGLGYKEFNTGDVLTAADANGYLASQVVMVFASAAARTSAIASPQEGMISYLKDTNSTEYYSGSAWVAIGGSTSSGLTLISPTSIAFSGSSASTSAGKTVFSAVSSLSLNGVFSSTYDNYLIITAPFTQSSSIMNFMRLRASGTDTTSGYNNAGWFMNAGGSWNTNPDVTDAMYHQQPGTVQGSAVMNIQNPNLAFATLMKSQRVTSGGQEAGNASSQSGSTQFDGFTLYQTSGTFTGTIRVYGFQN